jgi:hypothetical protein
MGSSRLGRHGTLHDGKRVLTLAGLGLPASVEGTGGHIIQEDGTPLDQRLNLNFVGAGVTAEDDEANNATKVTISGTDPTAIHVDVAAEISGITEKTTPIADDLLVIEDSAASNAKKRVKVGNLPGGAGGGAVVAIVDLTGQTADIAETNFDNTSTVGMYRVNVYLLTTTGDAGAGSVLVTIRYTDVVGEREITIDSLDLTSTTVFSGVTGFIPLAFHVDSGSISYEVTHTGDYGSAVYALYMRVERLPATPIEDSEPVIVYTTDDTPTPITSVTPVANSTTLVAGYIIAHRTGGEEGTPNINGWWSVIGAIKNDDGDISIANIYSNYGIYGFGGENPYWWSVTWDESPAGTIVLLVTGAVDNNITWEFLQSRLLPVAIAIG